MPLRILSLLIAITLPFAAMAQVGGVKFDAIKKGTKFHFAGDVKFIEEYIGIQKGLHVVTSTFQSRGSTPKKPFRFTRYDSQGRLVERQKTSFDLLIRFAPFHCEYGTAKTCTHQRIVIDTKTGKTKSITPKNFEVKGRGKTLRVVKNAKGNRIKSKVTLDKNKYHIAEKDYSMNIYVTKTTVPQ